MTVPNDVIRPGVLEVYCGPMKCGKSRTIEYRISRVPFLSDVEYLAVKPRLDTRSGGIKSRLAKEEVPCSLVDEGNPAEIISLLAPKHRLIIIDEAQFFAAGIEAVVQELVERDLNVLVAGLDLDFRGEPFGRMPQLLALADEVYKLKAVCEYPGCNGAATRTQRLIGGKPAPRDSPLVLIGDADAYEARCVSHHLVPDRVW